MPTTHIYKNSFSNQNSQQKRLVRAATIIFATFAIMMISGQITVAAEKDSGWSELPQYNQNQQFGGAERYLIHISTDKPIYRIGEQVYVRGVILEARTHKPLQYNVQSEIQIKGPKGNIVAQGYSAFTLGAAGFTWPVPDEIAGGEYKAIVNISTLGLAPAERKFDIRTFRAPRLKTQIKFKRDGYGPGDKVFATLHVERAEGGIPKNAKVKVSARVDDKEVYVGHSSVDAIGNASTHFALPKKIERGEGTLAMSVEDGGVVETATKTIPILLQTLDISMYPEGGDFIVGIPSRLYIEAKTPAQKPADIEAVVVDANDKEIAVLKTEHEGRGRVTFTPIDNQKYFLKILAPTGIKKLFALPATKKEGGTITATDDVINRGKPVHLKIAATQRGNYTITINKREIEFASTIVDLKNKKLTNVTIPLPKEADGVLIATLWGPKGEPIAERLIYRELAHKLQVSIKPDQHSYVPGGVANLEITTKDEKGNPVSAMVGITVTDDSVLEMIEKREQAPRLPVMVLLEPEVRELADAQIYLSSDTIKTRLAVDLLLATQGWRRFALKDIQEFINTYGDAARRVLAQQTQPITILTERVKYRPRKNGHHRRANMKFAHKEAVNKIAGFAPPPVPAMAPPPEAQAPKPKIADALKKPAAEQPANDKKLQIAEVDKREVEQKKDEALAMKEKMPIVMADEMVAEQSQIIYVREYAHQVRSNRQANDRIDFTETLYWHAGIQTDRNGKAHCSFGLSDAVTSFKVMADAYNDKGSLGIATESIQSRQPFYVEPKVPLQLTSGDVVSLPVVLANGTVQELTINEFAVRAARGIAVINNNINFKLQANVRKRALVVLATGNYVGKDELVVNAAAGNYVDKITRTLEVMPKGFPVTVARGGLIDADVTETIDLNIPHHIVPGSLIAEVAIYPAPLGNLTQALTRLMQEPYGCFEQTSSTSYPLTMAQQYFTSHANVDSNIVQNANALLKRSYQRLTSFECKDKGYEWFGGAAPGHEALTAYGIMQFHDMIKAKLSLVDEQMLNRTRTWLLARRDGKGGFQRNSQALDSFGGAPTDTTNAYIVWALLSAKEKGLNKEVAVVLNTAKTTKDSYITALGANIAWLSGNSTKAKSFMAKLADKQDNSGAVSGAVTTITRSGGEALAIETTSLAVLAWLHEPAYAANVEKAIKFLTSMCEGGRFSSTQATVLALKAIIAYDEAYASPKAAGTLQLLLDDKPIGNQVAFTKESQGAILMPSLIEYLSEGNHQLSLRMHHGARMPYSISIKYNTLQPASSAHTKLSLKTKLANSKIVEGKVTEIRVDVANITNAAVPTPVAIIGIPGGLEVRHDQLKELVKSKKIDAYEVLGREVVLYWRQLKAKEVRSLPISCVAAIPGKYTAPASRVYEYYTDEYKHWVAGIDVEIVAAELP
ncbi:MAG: A-macroglobulin complement component [Deltaproteobacteria bacterium]|nr:A-macroglobulin complement component [Deltaproteobacteria bacterium]